MFDQDINDRMILRDPSLPASLRHRAFRRIVRNNLHRSPAYQARIEAFRATLGLVDEPEVAWTPALQIAA